MKRKTLNETLRALSTAMTWTALENNKRAERAYWKMADAEQELRQMFAEQEDQS